MNLTLELSGLNLERLLRAAGACGVRMKNVRRMDERTMRVVVPAAQKKRMAALCEKYGIVASAAIAKKAIPLCNIVFEDGAKLKTDLSAYLKFLFDANPKSVGGALPDDNFYYEAK